MSGPDDPAVLAPPDEPPRTRWRLLPTLVCFTFGGMVALVSAAELLSVFSGRGQVPAMLPTGRELLGLTGSGTGGALWFVAAAYWWRRRWAWASGLTVLGLSSFVAGAMLS